MAEPTIVQAVRGTVSTTATASATLTSVPTVGNLLIAFVQARSVGFPGGIVTPIPTGWTSELSSPLGNGNPVVSVLSRVVQAGDTVGPYSFTVNGTVGSTRPLVSLYEISHQAAGTAWKQAITLRQFTTLRNPTFSTVEFTTSGRPCLVITTYGAVQEGAAATYAADPTETDWADVLPWVSATPATGSSNMSWVASDFPSYPLGKRRTFTTTIGSSALDYNSYTHVTFIAINGEDALPDAAYVDQAVAEVTLSADAEVRVDSIAAETVVSPDVEVRLDQLVSETVLSADAVVRVDSVVAEVVQPFQPPPAGAHVSSIILETVVTHPIAANNVGVNVTTAYLEVVVDTHLQANSAGLNVDMTYLEAVVAHGIVPAPSAPIANVLIPLVC